jgi:AcrR family transcriptional regulator
LFNQDGRFTLCLQSKENMASKKTRQVPDTNTEQKIKAAAKIVFHKKGFAAARTRDIAEEAGLNLALLNYYFRSKEKLFQLIMLETISEFLQTVVGVFNDEHSTLEKKVEQIAQKYIDLFILEPEMPIFIMSEVRSHGAGFLEKLPAINAIMDSVFMKQYKELAGKGKIAEPNPLHFLMNLMGMIVFPFIGSPIIKKVGKLSDGQFDKLMQERAKLIPVWVKRIFKSG